MRWGPRVLLLPVLLWLTCLCALPAQAAQRVVLQLKWLHQFQFAGYYAALEQGYYRDAGLEVQLQEARPGYDEQEEVLQGRAQFGVANSSLILQRGRGRPVVLLASIFQHSPVALLLRRDGRVDRIEQLPGRRVMLGPHDEEIQAMFRRLNLPLDSFERVEHSFNLQDLLQGKVDAMSVYVTDVLFQLDIPDVCAAPAWHRFLWRQSVYHRRNAAPATRRGAGVPRRQPARLGICDEASAADGRSDPAEIQ